MISFLHTDLYNYYFKNSYFKDKKFNKDNVLQRMFFDVKKINKKIIIPTYNYNFPKTFRFNYKKDKSQVGSFSEYFCKKYNKSRTSTPIFSTCNNINFDFNYAIQFFDPFGTHSEFDYLYKNNGKIINFGSSFAPTFIMFIERALKSGALYRYAKYFKGKTYYKNKFHDTILYYEVRPLKIKIEYDLKKIRNFLKSNKVLKIKETKDNFKFEEIDAKKFKDLIMLKINNDPYYLLNKSTIQRLKKNKLYNYKKFKIQQFEKNYV